ncbi:MAG: OmpA family protein [Oxalobacteraceae bacterium]|nr:MAG: OmpA family protein [Oxalobacteraceae bacterium]
MRNLIGNHSQDKMIMKFKIRPQLKHVAAIATLLAVSAQAAYKDHPLLSGMPGYSIDDVKIAEFGAINNGKTYWCDKSRQCNEKDQGFSLDGKLTAEGKVTELNYSNKGSGSTLAVARNYENAIKSLGGKKVSWLEGHEGDQVYLVEKDGRKVWIALQNFYATGYKLTFIEQQAMTQGVTAGQMSDMLNKQGFAILYINFDHNKSELKPDSSAVIGQIVKLLNQEKSLRLSVEGHTDNAGNVVDNKKLSEARAASVVKAIADTGIDGKRLESKGFGSAVSIADNRLEEGRAKNRRVELVRVK